MKNIFFFTILLLGVFCKLNAQEDIQYSFKESFELSNPENFSITTSDGDIAISSHNQKSILIYYSAKKNRMLLEIDKAEFERLTKDQYEIEIEKTNTGLSLQTKSKDNKSYIPSEDAIVLSYHVFLPRNMSVKLITSDGQIQVKDIDGTVSAISSDGNIALKDLNGEISAVTSDGNIQAKNLSDKNSITLTTSDGNILMKLIENPKIDLEARGKLVSLKEFQVDGDISRNKITGKINGGGKLLSLTTSDGNVLIK